MKNLINVLTLSATLLASAAHAAVVISDFTVPPATAGNMLTNWGNLANNVSAAWRAIPGTGSSGIGVLNDAGGNTGGFVELARSYSDNQRLAAAIWINLSDYGLETGQGYRLQFDYMVDRVGDRAYDVNAGIRYGVAESTSSYTELKFLAGTSTSLEMSNTAGNLLLNYEATAPISTPGQTTWTTFTSSRTFTISEGSTKLAIAIQGLGYGVGNNNWVDPFFNSYTYLGIDNVTLVPVPEPGTFALLAGFGALGLIVLRRRVIRARA